MESKAYYAFSVLVSSRKRHCPSHFLNLRFVFMVWLVLIQNIQDIAHIYSMQWCWDAFHVLCAYVCTCTSVQVYGPRAGAVITWTWIQRADWLAPFWMHTSINHLPHAVRQVTRTVCADIKYDTVLALPQSACACWVTAWLPQLDTGSGQC